MCIFWDGPLASPSDGEQRFSFLYYSRLPGRRDRRAHGSQPHFNPAVVGSIGRLNPAFVLSVTYDCIRTQAACEARCLDNDACAGYEFSGEQSICIELSRIPAPGMVVFRLTLGFVHVTKIPTLPYDMLAGEPDGSYTVTRANGGKLLTDAPAVGSEFVVTATVRLDPRHSQVVEPDRGDGSGYLFARTDVTGSRYFGLYFRTFGRGFFFYYRVAGQTAQLKLQFPSPPVDMLDGNPHTLVLHITATQVALTVDGLAVGTQPLVAPVNDCGHHTAECLLYLGQRNGGFPLHGASVTRAIISASTDTEVDAPKPEGPALTTRVELTAATPSNPLQVSDRGVLVPEAPAFGSVFTVMVSVAWRDTSRGDGYLFARSDATGSRYFGLYARSAGRGFSFYYRLVGSTTQRKASLPRAGRALLDGNFHTIETVVTAGSVEVRIDSVSVGTVALDGPVADCGAASAVCLTHLGQRHLGYPLSGSQINGAFAQVPTGAGTPSSPTSKPTDAVDTRGPVVSLVDSRACAGGVGTSQLPFPSAAASDAPVSSTFSIALRIRVAPGSFGYLFAKAGRDGSGAFADRLYSLYIRRSTGLATMYYQTSGARRSVQFRARLADGGEHRVLLSVNRGTVSLRVDAGPAETQTLQALVQDCSLTDRCNMVVGARASSAGGYKYVLGPTGCIIEAQVYTSTALVDHP